MTSFLILALLVCGSLQQHDSLLVMFWNVENFFDWQNSSDDPSSSESEFSENGFRHWTRGRFYTKCNAVAKTILAAGDRYGRIPDVIGFAELENGLILRRMVNSTPLRKLGFKTLHFDSPDTRGIDCGLIYRNLDLIKGEPKHLYESDGTVMSTRDILLAEFDSLCVLVNHHPSKVGGGKQERRDIAMSRLMSLCDSLEASGHPNILSVGDFNDDIWHDGSPGTIKYNGRWEKIDGILFRGTAEIRQDVFDYPLLLEPDRAFGGMKPRRTYSGPRYLGGVSDHLPIVVRVIFKGTD